jgi:hypothetical protein
LTNLGRPWTKEEDILALSVFVKRGVISENDPDVIDLSRMTNRSVGSIVRKLANFLALETGGQHGLRHYTALDRAVYSEFSNQVTKLEEEAERVRTFYRPMLKQNNRMIEEPARTRPLWVFQAREFMNGEKHYALYEEIPKILKQSEANRVVHWGTAEHRSRPFKMQVGDMVLLFQGGTKEQSKRGFYGLAVIYNLDGKCTAPKGGESHKKSNRGGRSIGIDLKYIEYFGKPIMPSIPVESSLTNRNLQKLIAGGKEGTAQQTVFGIRDEDWTKLSSYFNKEMRRKTHIVRGSMSQGARRGRKKIDPQRKAKIEKSAIKKVRSYFERLGYDVSSVEKDNLGWDLEASKEGIVLHLEVKGLSGEDISFQMTPNEYKRVKLKESNYRICVVTRALENPLLSIFFYSERSDSWQNEAGDKLSVSEITGALLKTVE